VIWLRFLSFWKVSGSNPDRNLLMYIAVLMVSLSTQGRRAWVTSRRLCFLRLPNCKGRYSTGRCIPKVDGLSLIKPLINVELRLFIFATNDEKPLVCHRGIRHKTGICRRENAGMIHCQSTWKSLWSPVTMQLSGLFHHSSPRGKKNRIDAYELVWTVFCLAACIHFSPSHVARHCSVRHYSSLPLVGVHLF
jgi:hypothetical protein